MTSFPLPDLQHEANATLPDWVGPGHPRPYICTVVPDAQTASRLVPHVNNVEYLRWVDRIAEMHARSLGLSRESLLEANRVWFVSRHELDYCAEAWPGETITIATWVRDVGRMRSWRDTIAWRSSDRRVILRAATCWVLVDILSRRPARVAAEWHTTLDPLQPSAVADEAGTSVKTREDA